MKKLEIIKIIKEEIAGVLSEEEARPFTIKYKVEAGEGEGYKFVATVVDKSGNKEFESFSHTLSSFNSPRQAAHQIVTNKARNYMQSWAKENPPIGPYIDPQRPGNYDSHEAAQKALNSEIRPLVIIFSSDNCPECRELESELVRLGLREKLFILNLADTAAKSLKKILAPYAPSTAKTVMSYIGAPGRVLASKEAIVNFLKSKKSELVAIDGTQNKKSKKPVKAKVPKKINQPEKEDEFEEPKQKAPVKPKAKTILEQLPPTSLIGKVYDISIFGRKGYKVKFHNSEPGFLEVNGDGIISIQLPNKKVREFKLKKVMFANFAKAEKTNKNRLKISAKIGPRTVKGSLDAKQLDKLVEVCLGSDPEHETGLKIGAAKESKVGKITGKVVRTK